MARRSNGCIRVARRTNDNSCCNSLTKTWSFFGRENERLSRLVCVSCPEIRQTQNQENFREEFWPKLRCFENEHCLEKFEKISFKFCYKKIKN